MDGTYFIMLAGFGAAEEKLASRHFTQAGHRVSTAKGVAEAEEMLLTRSIDLVYLHPSAEDAALRELETISRRYPSLPVVLACPQNARGLVLDAWHAGAADILFLPLSPESLDASLEHVARLVPGRGAEQAPRVQARFFHIDEAGNECHSVIFPPRFTIGRLHDNDLILSPVQVSRHHAEVLVQDGEYLLRDMSTQGTYVNGTRIKQTMLANGDRIQLGGPHGPVLVFHSGDLLQSLLGVSDPRSEISLSVRGFKEVGMLFAALRALSSTPVLDDLLTLVVDTAIEMTGAERGFIMLKEKGGELQFRCARDNRKFTLDGSAFQTSRRVPHEVFKTGQPVVIKDLDLGDELESHSATRKLGLRSISCVPLRYFTMHDSDNLSRTEHAETIGVLYVDSSSVGTGSSDMRVDALRTLATEAAMAVYNARLYKDSQDKRRMQEQLAVSHEIQQALLPDPIIELPYARACSQSIPCYEVGGDYFDYFNQEGGCFGFALGDVAGKGMPAALLASLIQGLLSAQRLFEIPLPVSISNVNRILAKRGTGNRFMTFFFGILDPEGNCTYVNAGHNPPVLLGRDGSMKELTAGGMVMGLFAEAQYEAGSVRLEPGDHLVLFTDGILEARNVADEEFGAGRLSALLLENCRASTGEILESLRDAVLTFAADAPQHDDITLMVVGYREI